METITREHVGDLVADGIDVAVRLGEPLGASLVSRKLADVQVLTVASPEYLARRGRPPTPQDLSKHSCIDFRDPQTGRAYDWEFHRKRKIPTVNISSRLLLSDAGTNAYRMPGSYGYCAGTRHRGEGVARRRPPRESLSGLAGRNLSAPRALSLASSPAAKVRAFIEFVLRTVR